jgi:hypothetical protein
MVRISAAAAVALFAVTVAACGSSSSSSHPAASATLLGTQVQQDCTSVTDVLSDGPDPGADPVGYAQAQILPLRQLKLSDAALRGDVLALANAYQALAGGHGSAAAVTKAENSVNSICPQAAP